jgi:hypothetical protein
VTTRRPPPGDTPDATALLEWPGISRSDGGDTDPTRKMPVRVVEEDATGRHTIDDAFDDLRPSALPSAWVSEFEVSDLDGDVVGPGAATTIMQLPPEMMGHDDASELTAERDAVELMKWRAGPPGPTVSTTPLPSSPDHGDGTAATLPALSLDMVRAAAAAMSPLPPRPMPVYGAIDASDDEEEDTLGGLEVTTADRLRATLEEAMSALLAAQSCADDGEGGRALQGHLARAVQLLSTAQDLGDDL